MRLYTSKVIADWLGLTERRVRQLRDEGIIEEQAPGLYDLRATTRRYISYLRSGSLADERAGLTRAKREAAEMENALRRGELHRTEEIESGIKTMLLNIRGRFLSLPAKLSPALAAMGGDQASIFDELKHAIDETLEELRDFNVAFAQEEDGDGEKKNKDPCAGCVWKLWTGTSEKVLCSLPVCKRAEYERMLRGEKEPDHEEKAPDD